ncbi:MAG: hypothetical protein J1E78_08210 [Muribaculaceae bacterium]|nr:hypothetical protein [Muribaculaceae bacterium]
MSKEDKRKAKATDEEEFFSGINALPLQEWEKGKIFIATDDKALLIYDTQQQLFPNDSVSIKGKLMQFAGVESKMNAAGDLTVVILFTDGERLLAYDTNKEFESAMTSFKSDEVPMMIDAEMVMQARKKLVGKNLWTRSNLWYDENGERIDGKKYIPVTVTAVEPGSLLFPLKVKIKDESGEEAYMFMNFGNSGTESRSFHNLFSISDIRKHYPTIEPETWDYISIGKVKSGMTKDECRLALGNPVDVNSGHDYSQTIDIWNYDNGKVLWFEDGRLVRFRQ